MIKNTYLMRRFLSAFAVGCGIRTTEGSRQLEGTRRSSFPRWARAVGLWTLLGQGIVHGAMEGKVTGWGYQVVFPPHGYGTAFIGVSAGLDHNLALKGDGAVVGWGANFNGQSTVPSGLSRVQAVAAGAKHSLALTQDGTVVAWGDNAAGQSTVPFGLSDVVAIAAAFRYNLALRKDGTVVAWGTNHYGPKQRAQWAEQRGGMAYMTMRPGRTNHRSDSLTRLVQHAIHRLSQMPGMVAGRVQNAKHNDGLTIQAEENLIGKNRRQGSSESTIIDGKLLG